MIQHVMQKIMIVFGGDSTEYRMASDQVVMKTSWMAERIQAIANSATNAVKAPISAIKNASVAATSAMNQALSSSQTALTNFAASWESNAKSIAANISRTVSLPATALKAASTYAFASFDDAMTKSKAVMEGLTADMAKRMEDQAKSLAWNTETSATQLASAYYYLASAGKSAANSLELITVVNQFAIAGTFELEKATELLADTQAALGLASTDAAEDMQSMSRVSDVLVKGNIIANASVEQLAKSLTTKSGAALRLLNKDIEEGVALLAAYAAQGVKGEMAGEKLSIVLREMQHANMKHNDEWVKLGINLYNAEGNMLPVVDVIEQMEKKFMGLSDESKYAAFSMLGFRSESMGAIQPLLGQTAAIREYETQLRSASGYTDAIAKNQRSFMTELKILGNRINIAAIELGEKLAPSLAAVNAAISTGLKLWTDLDPRLQSIAAHAVTIAAAIGPIATMLAYIPTGNIKAISSGFMQIAGYARIAFLAIGSGALAGLTAIAPYVAIIAAIGAALVGVAYLLVGPEGFAAGWEYTKGAVNSTWETIVGFCDNFQHNIGALSTWFYENWATIFVDVGLMFGAVVVNGISNYLTCVETFIRLTTAFLGWLTVAVPAAFQYVFSFQMALYVLEGMGAVADAVISTMSFILDACYSGAQAIADVQLSIMTGLWNLIVRSATLIKDAVWGIFTGDFPDPFALMQELASAALDETLKIAAKVDEKLNGALDAAGRVIKDKVEMLQDDFKNGQEDMNFFNTAGDIMKQQMEKMKGPLDGFQATTLKGPNLILTTTKKTEEAVKQTVDTSGTALVKATDQVDDLLDKKDKLAKPVYFTVKGDMDAVGKDSAEAMQRLQEYRASVMVGEEGAAIGVAPGKDKNKSEKSIEKEVEMLKVLEAIKSNTTPVKSDVVLKKASISGSAS